MCFSSNLPILVSYSFRKCLSVLNKGLGADPPSPHKLASLTYTASSSSLSRSILEALLSQIFCNRSCIILVPTLQGTHFPQLSSIQNSIKNLATSTISDD